MRQKVTARIMIAPFHLQRGLVGRWIVIDAPIFSNNYPTLAFAESDDAGDSLQYDSVRSGVLILQTSR
jgi:hypothetical protein